MKKTDKFVVGLTGGIGSGKSVVSREFEKLGIDVIDADVIAREVVMPGTPALNKITEYFGLDARNHDGTLNRAFIREKVFNNEADKVWLNQLLHPAVRRQMLEAIEKTTSPYCILAVPLLIENKLTGMVNRVLVIDCPEDMQIERASQRDGSDRELIQSIMRSQASRQERLAVADDVISNDGALSLIPPQVNHLHHLYLAETSH